MTKSVFGKFSLLLSFSLIVCIVIQVIVGLKFGKGVSENVLFIFVYTVISIIASLMNILGAILGLIAFLNEEVRRMAMIGIIINTLSLLFITIGYFPHYYLVLFILGIID